jgi:hypothetical protein
MGAANSRAAEKSGAAAETSSGDDETGENNSQAEDEPGDEDEGLKMSFQRARRRRVSKRIFSAPVREFIFNSRSQMHIIKMYGFRFKFKSATQYKFPE